METLTFKLQEDNFEGPLDLLLYLVGKNKMNLYDINIMELIEQYTAAIQTMQADKLEVSSEFIDMAAHLVQMKSALLLPRSPEAERMKAELTGRLIEYSTCKQVAAELGSRARDLYTAVRQPQKPEGPAEYSRKQDPDRLVQAFQPPYLGGEQERQMRPGTENLPYAMGLAAAATRLAKTMKSRDTAMRALNRQLREGLKAFPEVVINSPENAVPEVLNFSEMCIKSETMLAFLAEEQIYVSSASACGRGQPSHTLAAMGRDPLAIDTAIRVSFCADNTPEDVDAFLNRFEDGMKHLQKIRK